VDAGLALFGLALVGLGARTTRERFWGAPSVPRRERQRRAALTMLVGTGAVVLVFAVWGTRVWTAAGPGPEEAWARLLRPGLAGALALFVPWALLQQTLFQFYLHGRLRALLGTPPPLIPAVLTGILYGVVHLPDVEVTLLTVGGGIAWSWIYQRDRSLGPLALSHAVLGTTYFTWVRGRDLAVEWLGWLRLGVNSSLSPFQ
jgi:membrane protease YdiL (CAAX protease family)